MIAEAVPMPTGERLPRTAADAWAQYVAALDRVRGAWPDISVAQLRAVVVAFDRFEAALCAARLRQ